MTAAERLQDFLAACARPDGGAAMLAALAPDALVPWERSLVPARELDPAGFAEARAAEADGRPVFTAFEAGEWRTDGQDGVLTGTVAVGRPAIATAGEAAGEQRLPIAAGLAGPDWRLRWITLEPQSWDAALLQAAALSESVSGPPRQADTWLERAYARRHGRAEPRLVYPAEARFGCQATTRCCTNSLAIILPPSAQAMVDALPWERLHPPLAGTRLTPRADGTLLLRGANETCRFLDENDRCRIHNALGRPVFGPCTLFPFVFAQTPEGVVVTATTGCKSAREGQGPLFSERHEDLYERLHLAPVVYRTEAYRLTAEHEVDWPAYQAAEAAVLAALEGPGSLAERLLAAVAPLEALLPPVPLVEVPRQSVAILIAAVTDGLAGHDQIPESLGHDHLRQPELMARTLKTMINAKRLPFMHDLLTAVNLAALLYVITLALQATQRDASRTDAVWEHIGHLTTHSPGFGNLPLADIASPLLGPSMRQPGYVARLMASLD